MGTILQRRRSFRPSLDGSKLEDRLVLSAAGTVQAEVVTALAVDPLVPTNHGTIKVSQVQGTISQIHSAFQTFLTQVNRASQNAIKGLGNGQTEANVLSSLRAYTALQGGNLEAKVQQATNRLPGGVQYLFSLPQGTVPGGYPTDGTSGPDLRYYVPPKQRLKQQIDDMLAMLDKNDKDMLQTAVNQNASLTILQTYQGCKAATNQYVNFATQNGDFTVATR